MHLLDQRLAGIAILLLLAALVVVKRAASGSVLERPKGGWLIRAVNSYNLFFLLIVNPAIAIVLVLRRLDAADPAPLAIASPPLSGSVELAGLALLVGGYFLMAWALLALGRNYQLGGLAPRPGDTMVGSGPYRWIRHPMYAAALCISMAPVGRP